MAQYKLILSKTHLKIITDLESHFFYEYKWSDKILEEIEISKEKYGTAYLR